MKKIVFVSFTVLSVFFSFCLGVKFLNIFFASRQATYVWCMILFLFICALHSVILIDYYISETTSIKSCDEVSEDNTNTIGANEEEIGIWIDA